MTDSWLDSSAIAVVGGKGSGKTALCYSILDQMDKPVYVFDNPKPHLIRDRGWNVMYRLEEMYDMQGCVCWLDEPQLTIPTANKRANEGLQKLLSISRHRDITLLISTCDTRWVTRALEAYIDIWIVKDIEAKLVKQGAIIHKIIKKDVVIDSDQFRLEPHQYLMYARRFPALDGRHTFELPEYFTDEHSKPYSMVKVETAVESATDVATKVRPSRNGKVEVAG